MSENIKINVNGNQIESAPNKLLIEACEDSGIHIPRFCWHKRLDPVGMCRMCLVEILVTPFFVLRIIIRVVAVTNRFEPRMKGTACGGVRQKRG